MLSLELFPTPQDESAEIKGGVSGLQYSILYGSVDKGRVLSFGGGKLDWMGSEEPPLLCANGNCADAGLGSKGRLTTVPK